MRDTVHRSLEEAAELVNRAVDHAAHLLPAQRPIEAFVHHNTLHAFEDLPFDEAVVDGGALYRAAAYLTEAEFRRAFEEGRILEADVDAALAAAVPDGSLTVGPHPLPLREAVRRLMHGMPEDLEGPALAWRVHETDLLHRLPSGLPRAARETWASRGAADRALPRLWEAVQRTLPRRTALPELRRPRDRAVAEGRRDPDDLVAPVMIRWCAAYLDHGQAYWPMMQREEGFYVAMLHWMTGGDLPVRGWMGPARAKARALLRAGTPPEVAAAEALARLGVSRSQVEPVVTATLLAMGGWAGMFVQLAERPDLAPGPALPTRLVDVLAIRLLLDEAALAFVGRDGAAPAPRDPAGRDAWRLFHAALLCGLHPDDLDEWPGALAAIGRLLDAWPAERRQAIWQIAYERRYRVTVLDALLAHEPPPPAESPRPRAQILTCIDDREESLRRHLEELDPSYETYGLAGHFNLFMLWHGLGDARPVPLAPQHVAPRHLVVEQPLPDAEARWAQAARVRGLSGHVRHTASAGTTTLLRGGAAALLGFTAVVPMAAAILAPSWNRRALGQRPLDVPTRVVYERTDDTVDADGRLRGFSVDEMVRAVGGALRAIGLVHDFADLVIAFGHGASSVNNPHAAAYNCGACAGGRGGPNARLFALMANRADVRARLRGEGLTIPESTWFVGGYHDTTTDQLVLYDLEHVPDRLRDPLARVQRDLDEARRRNAHERCRRFEHAALDLTPTEALRHVEDRALDLAQPRPEYNHATNALCIVGRRSWTRGLFLDRRVFLTSYDPRIDPDHALLHGTLAVVGPVGAGINLEYYFSRVDPDRYGSGSKLPHNLAGLVGVMDGHASDLRTGLYRQMVEIHEPMRLLVVVEATPEALSGILERDPGLRRLVVNGWILVAAFDPEARRAWFFEGGTFVEHTRETRRLPRVARSAEWYRGRRDNLPPAIVAAGRASTEASVGGAA